MIRILWDIIAELGPKAEATKSGGSGYMKTWKEVRFYITPEEYRWFEQITRWLFEQNAIPRPTPGTFAKAASYTWYNEVNQVI